MSDSDTYRKWVRLASNETVPEQEIILLHYILARRSILGLKFVQIVTEWEISGTEGDLFSVNCEL